MSEETTTSPEAEESTTPVENDVEKQAFLDRLGKESAKRKTAEKTASEHAKMIADLQARLEERESAGLPELERERKAREKLEAQMEAAEKRAADAEQRVLRTQREQWISEAAAAQNFANPARVARLIDDLDSIDDAHQAERAVKALAKSDSYLLKAEEPKLPGRVLENGRPIDPASPRAQAETEGNMILEGIRNLQRQGWQDGGAL